MIELSVIVWLLTAFMGYVGLLRGFTKEVISLAGIVLGLFAMYQFDTLIRQQIFASLPPDQLFYVQTFLFLLVVFFAYQTRALVGGEAVRERTNRGGRDPFTTKVLGGLTGLLNGYLVSGTIWYFMDINRLPNGEYPLAPFVTAPLPGTANAAAVSNLPLYLLTQNGGDLLALAVVGLFIVVLVLI